MSTAANLNKSRRLIELFQIDARSLALFRIAIGSLLLLDMAMRVGDLHAMYSDDGIMPRSAVWELLGRWRWSIHWLFGSPAYHAALLGIGGMLALALIVGYHTRIATVGSWFLLASLHTRTPLVQNGGDTLLLLLLFWSMFVPLGRTASLDARSRRRPGGDWAILSVGSVAILLQVCLMYWCTAAFKFFEGWGAGNGLQNALAWGGYNKPFGDWLLGYPEITQLLSMGTVWLELIGPLLLFVPWKTPLWRGLILVAFLGLHVGIELSMYVHLFSYVSMASWILFVPAQFWDWLGWPGESSTEALADDRGGGRGDIPFAASVLCGTCLAFVVAWNLATIIQRAEQIAFRDAAPVEPIGATTAGRRETPAGRLIRLAQPIADATTLRQKWNMFAAPPTASSWFVARARLKNGQLVDLLQGGTDLDVSRPDRIALRYPNHRWRKFFHAISMQKPGYHPFRELLADYLFRQWNAGHDGPRQVVVLDLVYFFQELSPDTDPSEYVSRVLARKESAAITIEETIDFRFLERPR